MSKKKNKPWDENWEFLKKISSGGQGQTSLVQSKNPSDTPGQYVLKILNRQNDIERRGRMYREVAALNTLKHFGIPKIIDSNSRFFNDLDIPLYMVSEFIPGKTLYETVKENSMNLGDAVIFLIKLLDVVEYCHNRGIGHRDIKPDNIIIRNNDFQNPVLIDFGLSFNRDDDSATNLTATEQQLGNRFLHLTELSGKSSLQRDPRSDITQCCGIFFFVITGKYPKDLLDAEGNKPHQRVHLNKKLSVLSESKRSKVNRIFDRAFETKIDDRWQSIPALKNALNDLLKPSSEKSEDYLTRIENKLSDSSEHEQRKLFQNLAQQILEEIWDIARSAARELGSDFSCILMGTSLKKRLRVKINWKYLTFSQKVIGIGYIFSDKSFTPEFRGYITGNELVLVSDLKGKEVELLRTPLSGEADFTGFSKRLKEFYYEGVDSIV